MLVARHPSVCLLRIIVITTDDENSQTKLISWLLFDLQFYIENKINIPYQTRGPQLADNVVKKAPLHQRSPHHIKYA